MSDTLSPESLPSGQQTLLYLQASPRGERSHSIAVADAFVAAYAEVHPDTRILTRNLFTLDLPPFDGPALDAKYAILGGGSPGPEHREAWGRIEGFIDELRSADRYVLAVPMWNYSIPYRLKQYLDIVIQPGYTFKWTPESGYTGLLTGRPTFIAYARGGAYPEGTPDKALDHQMPYLEYILSFIGITDVTRVVVEPTLAGGPETASDRRADGILRARELAATW
jgi:FMN-dependent NADH-azoreductase